MNTIVSSIFSKLHHKFLLRSILVLTLGIIGFETITFYRMSETIRELTLENMQSSVLSASVKIDDELARLRTDLEIISNLPALEAFYLNTQYGLENEATQYKNSLTTFFKKQSSRNDDYIAFKICNHQHAQLALDSRIATLTSTIDGRPCQPVRANAPQKYLPADANFNRPLLLVSRQVYSDEVLLGIIEIYFDLTDYFAWVDSQPIYQSGFIAVVDADGTALSTSDRSRLLLQKLTSFNLQDPTRPRPFETVTNDDNEKVIIYQSKLKRIDWSIYAFVLEEEIFADLYAHFKMSSALVIALIFVELLFLSYFTKKLITHRIDALLEATKRILSGNFQHRVKTRGIDEISQLSDSFNIMTDSLQEQMVNIQTERANLQQSKQLLQNIIDHTSALVTIKDLDGRYRLVNHAYSTFFNLPNEEVLGKTDHELFSKTYADSACENDRKVLEKETPCDFEETTIDQDGLLKTFLSVKFPLKNTSDEVYAVCSIATNITERIAEEKALQKLNARLTLSSTVLENIIEAVIVTNADFNIIDVNPATIVQFGYSRKELIGQKPAMLRSEKHDENFFDKMYGQLETYGYWHGEIWEKTKGGSVIPLLLTVKCLRNDAGEITHYAGIYSDISDMKQNEAKLQKLAHFDSLTGLANRLLLEERTNQAILQAKRDHHKVTMLFIDLDNFKYINDTLGHDVGDQLLIQAGSRFNTLLRSSDTLARQGGDEFVVLLSKTAHARDAAVIADKIKAAGSRPFMINGQELYVSTSIGIAVYPDDAVTTKDLFKCADMAMYAAKDSGKNSYRFYAAELNHAAVNRLKIEKSLRQAIDKNDLELYYQPQIDVQNGQVIKAEALLRWRDETGKFIPPDRFIPIAEESGLIVVLGEWVVARALADLQKINRTRRVPLKVSINLSARQFRHHDLAKKLNQIVLFNNTSPEVIEFEVTEGLLIDDFELAEKILREIRDFGFSIALDDFGKGYSSLNYLKHFPIDTLKMDRTFMSDLITDHRTQAIVRASVSMARALGMQVVFEGTETEEQYQFIRSIGKVSVQGYYCSRPLAVNDLIDYLPNKSELY